MKIIENNLDKIDWEYFSQNPNVVNIIYENIYNIKWDYLSTNDNFWNKYIDINIRNYNCLI